MVLDLLDCLRRVVLVRRALDIRAVRLAERNTLGNQAVITDRADSFGRTVSTRG